MVVGRQSPSLAIPDLRELLDLFRFQSWSMLVGWLPSLIPVPGPQQNTALGSSRNDRPSPEANGFTSEATGGVQLRQRSISLASCSEASGGLVANLTLARYGGARTAIPQSRESGESIAQAFASSRSMRLRLYDQNQEPTSICSRRKRRCPLGALGICSLPSMFPSFPFPSLPLKGNFSTSSFRSSRVVHASKGLIFQGFRRRRQFRELFPCC